MAMGILTSLSAVRPGRLLELVVPQTCAACGLPGEIACEDCLDVLVPPPDPLCATCGHPGPIPLARCPRCPSGISRARQAVLYLGPAPALVMALKDGRRRTVADLLAARIAAEVAPPPSDVPLVPVPLGRARLAQRGFNQSLLLARALGRRWDRPVAELLAREREGPPQRGSRAAERARQVAGAFALRPGAQAPATVWLVDDVLTTGATLSACARALRRAGAREVGAVCFARVPADGPGRLGRAGR
jgi:ComF family protein